MNEICIEVPSKGLCQTCRHNIYDDKTYPSWMACYCPEPKIEVAATPQPPVYYDLDC